MKLSEDKIVYLDLSQIKPYENNPRINDGAVDAVSESIKKFGFRVPIVLDKNNVIVCGHTRFKASKKLGLERVPCIIASDLSEKQINAFRIAENRTGEFAEWDDEKLRLEFQSLIDMGGTIEESGFDDESLKELMTKYDVIDELDDTGKEDGDKTVNLMDGDVSLGIKGKSKILQLIDYNCFDNRNLWGFPRLIDRFPRYEEEKDKKLFIKKGNHCDNGNIVIYGSCAVSRNIYGGSTVAFYTEDVKFERFFIEPSTPTQTMINVGVKTCIGLDFSTYFKMTKMERLWSVFRSLTCSRYIQEAGINLIPSIIGAPDDFQYFKDCIPKGAPLAVQIHRAYTEAEVEIKRKLIKMWIDYVQPSFLWVYHSNKNEPRFRDLFNGIDTIFTLSFSDLRFGELKKNK